MDPEQIVKQCQQQVPPASPFPPMCSSHDSTDVVVCSRVRPILPFDNQHEFNVISGCNPKFFVHEPKLSVTQRSTTAETHEFTFDYAFDHNTDNDTIFNLLGKPQVDYAIQGNIAVYLAYGQTCSGKTFTITSLQEQCVSYIFNKLGFDHNYSITASVFEILGSNCTDLLSSSQVSIREDLFGHVQVQGCLDQAVTSGEELNVLLNNAYKNRKTIGTMRNHTSSRSHAITRITFKNNQFSESEPGILYFIDLAGSERAKDQQTHDKERIAEAKEINKSLMNLKECIRKRTLAFIDTSSKKHHHVPYRSSKITLLLKDVFELTSIRQCRTVFLCCVSPLYGDLPHSINSLRYAEPLRLVSHSRKRQVFVNQKDPAHWDNEKMGRWVTKFSHGLVDPEVLLPGMSGMQLLRLPETEFMRRCISNKFSEKQAKLLYTKLWEKAIDVRTRNREILLKNRTLKVDDHDEELLRRVAAESFNS
ncbi:hypothetical protein P9112_003094 [Eukaryota sp. TZLM1-RC]